MIQGHDLRRWWYYAKRRVMCWWRHDWVLAHTPSASWYECDRFGCDARKQYERHLPADTN